MARHGRAYPVRAITRNRRTPLPITQISQSATVSTSTAITGEAVGDLMVSLAWANNNTAQPTPPSGWTLWPVNDHALGSSFGNPNLSVTLAYRFATSTSESMAGWGGAISVAMAVFRNATPGASSFNGGIGTAIGYPALTLNNLNGVSWGGRMGASLAASNMNTQTLTGWTLRSVSPTAMAIFDSGGPLFVNPAAGTQTVSGSGGWFTASFELQAT